MNRLNKHLSQTDLRDAIEGKKIADQNKHIQSLLLENHILELNKQDEILDKQFGISRIKGKIILVNQYRLSTDKPVV